MGADKSVSSRSIGLLDLLLRLPAVLMDVPVIVRGARTGLLAQPNSTVSIGTVFADRAARYGDRIFLRFGDERISYARANAIANRYAAVLAERGVGRGDEEVASGGAADVTTAQPP
jgi:fatty-acyl-CoA synthase